MPLKVFTKIKKGCKDMYICVLEKGKRKLPLSQNGEKKNMIYINEFDWGNIFEFPFKLTLEFKL